MKRNIFATLAMAVLLLALLTGCGKKNDVNVDMSEFTPPEDFVWEGSYLDAVDGQVVMTIEKSGSKYICSIGVPATDMSHIDSYTFTAKKAKDTQGLEYTKGVHTSFDLPSLSGNEAVMDSGLSTQEIYTDGTGSIYYLEGALYWIDDKENAGAPYQFVKQTEEEMTTDEADDGSEEETEE
ncbi:MAG: hypothetical protein K6G07_00845 [Lachnospiraceae bacterium]|nr:hypothetical protein [Lachnospiraceae bacterium]